jgi:hypothetical protein
MKRLAALPAATLALAGALHAADQDLQPGERGVTAPGQPSYSVTSPPAINRLDFDFRIEETRAWLNETGDFQITGWLKHAGLLCATYRTGLRFGIGAPGCLNVNWITDPHFVTSEFQCNGARVQHAGGDTVPAVGEQVGKITCAERVITCSGNCK